jgi:hypothetical protein
MGTVARGTTVNLGTSMSEDPNRGGGYAYFVCLRFVLPPSSLYDSFYDILKSSGDRSGSMGHDLSTPDA